MQRTKFASLKGYTITRVKISTSGKFVEIWGKKEGDKLSKLIASSGVNWFFDKDDNFFEDQPKTVYLSSYDIQLAKDIRDKIGKVSAVKVFRLMTKCSLKDAVDYVNGLEG